MSQPTSHATSSATVSPPTGGSAPGLYDAYYSTDRELAWYEICAKDKARNIVNICGPLKPKRVLDVGAGSGAVLQRYLDAGLGEEVHAVEISASGLEQLDRRKSSRFVGGKYFDGIRIPYPDDSFDLVILSHVLEHVEHPRLLLHEIRRVAKQVYVEVPLECSSLKGNLRGDWVMDTTGHINYYNQHILRRQLQTSGWKVDRVEIPPPSVEPYKFMYGTKGVINWNIKRTVMAISPRLAAGLFAWNCASLSTRAPLPPISLGLVDAHLIKATSPGT